MPPFTNPRKHRQQWGRFSLAAATIVLGLVVYGVVSFATLKSAGPSSSSPFPPASPLLRHAAASQPAAKLSQEPREHRSHSLELNKNSPTLPAASTAPILRRRDTVLAMSQSIATAPLLVFVRSLRQHNADAQIVLFQKVGDTSFSSELQSQYDVTVQRIDDASLPAFMDGFHPSTTRWHIMLQYVQMHAASMRSVLLADVRDTMFQQDPFSAITVPTAGQAAPGPLPNTALLSWYEESGTIGRCSWNSGWVKDCFGPDMLRRLHSERIICSGITLGGHAAVHRYLQRMNSTVFEKRSCERNGVDQGMHQVVMRDPSWQGGLQVRLTGVELGQVAHMQSMRQRSLPADGLLRATSNNQVYSIVHQYDRAASITADFMAKYGQVPQG